MRSIGAGVVLLIAASTLLVAGPASADDAPASITSLSVSSGTETGGTSVTITGTGFEADSQVDWDGDVFLPTVIDGTTMTVTAPAHAVGTVDVTVTTTTGTSAPVQFTYLAAPRVTKLTPAAGWARVDTVVTISGSGFTGTSAVTVGGIPATDVVLTSDTSIKATLPAGTGATGSGLADVVVTTPVGASPTGAADRFFYNPFSYTTDSSGNATIVEYSGPSAIVIPSSIGDDGIPHPVTAIGDGIFAQVNATSVVIPASVTTIGRGAFWPNRLTSVAIPDSVTRIDDYAFYNGKLTSVKLPDSLTTISNDAFAFNPVVSLSIPDSVTSIGDYAFYAGKLASLTIPDSVTTIGDFAFAYNPVVTLALPNSVTNIGIAAFFVSSLTSLTIPSSVTTLESSAFSYSSSLVSVHFEGNAPSSLGRDIFYSAASNFGLTYTAGATGFPAAGSGYSYTWDTDSFGVGNALDANPTVVKVSPAVGFAGGRTDVTITGSGFTGTPTVTVGGQPASNVVVVSATKITATVLAGTGLADVVVTTLAGDSIPGAGAQFLYNPFQYTHDASGNATITAYSGPSALVIPSTIGDNGTSYPVTAIGNQAFIDQKLISVSIPSSVTTIGEGAFRHAFQPYFQQGVFQTVTIPSSVTTIGTMAFSDNKELLSANFEGDAPANIGDLIFGNNNGLLTVLYAASATGFPSPNSGYSIPWGTSNFAIAYAVPTITRVTPTSGPAIGATTVSIRGTGFLGTTGVTVGGNPATPFTVVSDTVITATLPAGIGTVDVSVTTPAGTSVVPGRYTYIQVPTVSGLSVASGTTAGGTTVVISGTRFTSASTVTFGSAVATTVSYSSMTGKLTATSPAGAAGTVDVAVSTTGGSSSSTSLDQFTYITPPTVTSLSPALGAASGGTDVVISGTKFTSASTVTFGGIAATAVSVNSFIHQLTATAPAGAVGTVQVIVTTDGVPSLVTATDEYTYFAAVSVGNFVWSDTSRDGIQDAGEPGIQGVVLTLTDPGNSTVMDVYGHQVGPATTDASGAYLFSNLPALPAGQSYTVSVATPAGFIATLPQAANSTTGTDSSTGSAASGDLTTDGASDLTLGFGFIVPSVSVGNFVWSDTSRNGIQDAGEPGLAGVVLTLTGPDGKPVVNVNNIKVGTVTTDPNGAYYFVNLPVLLAGQHYTVTVATPAGFIHTIAHASGGSAATDSSTGSASSGDLTTNGAADNTLGFGFVVPLVAPTVTGLTPGAGFADANTMVTITGTGFTSGTTTVSVGGHPADGIIFNSPTSITAILPFGTGTSHVIVTSLNGFSEPTADNQFVFNPFSYSIVDGSATITGYSGPGGAVDIPLTIGDDGNSYTVTAIQHNAFENMSLTSVTIPNTVTDIGSEAFKGNDLTAVIIPASVTTIGADAFASNPYLASVHFNGNAPAALGLDAFEPDRALIIEINSTANGFNTQYWQSFTTRILGGASSFTLVPSFGVGSLIGDATISGTGVNLPVGSSWLLQVFSIPQTLAGDVVGATGAMNFIVALPKNLPAGNHHVIVTGTSATGQPISSAVWFTLDANGRVLAISTAGPTPTLAELAMTGSTIDIVGNVLLGVFVILLGTVLVLRRRFRFRNLGIRSAPLK